MHTGIGITLLMPAFLCENTYEGIDTNGGVQPVGFCGRAL